MKKLLAKLHHDEKGADMIEYLLIFAAIALPLMAVLLWFKNDIGRWAGEMWGNVKDDPDSVADDPTD